MIREIRSKREAAEEWVKEFNAINREIIAELMSHDIDDWTEITLPSVYDRVYHFDSGESGEITAIVDYTDEYEEDCYYYEITLDNGEVVRVDEENDFEIQHDDLLPMWGTMWSFGDGIDDFWLKDYEGLKAMSDCGFRIFESYKYGYFFGIDGAGYDFYESHWIPLYEKRGLKWHNEEALQEV